MTVTRGWRVVALGVVIGALAQQAFGQASAGAAASAAPSGGPPPLEAYGDLPAVEQMVLAPDGKRMAVVATVKGMRRLLVTDETRTLKSTLPLGDAKLRHVSWCAPRLVCATLSQTEKLGLEFTRSQFEAFYTAVLPADGGDPRFVFKNVNNVVPAIMGTYGYRAVKGRRLGYFSALELRQSADRLHYEFDKGEPTLFSVDLETMAIQRKAAATDRGADRKLLIGTDGEVAAQFDSEDSSGKWTIKARSGAVLAKGQDKLGDVSLVALGKDGNSVVYGRRDPTGKQLRLFEVPLAGGAETELAPGSSVDRVFVDSDDGRMVGYLPEDTGAPALPVLFDAAMQGRLRGVYRAFPQMDVQLVDFTKGMAQVLVKTSGNGDPGTYFLVDMLARRADPMGDERPLIRSAMVGPVSTVSYKASDGLELDGILTLPPGREAKNLPAIMLPHGGPFGVADRARLDWQAQALASRGYTVLQPNFRGSGNRGAEFLRAGYGQWGRKMQTDISDGLAELARRGIVDPKRVCIVGGSYGGYASLAGVTLQKGIYRCAVAVAPVSDLRDMYQTVLYESGDNPMAQRNLDLELGPVSGFAAVSPRKHVADADAPIMIIHGKDDTTVPFSQGARMVDALKEAKKPVEFVVLDKEDHYLSRAETRKAMLEACMRFVLAHNPAD